MGQVEAFVVMYVMYHNVNRINAMFMCASPCTNDPTVWRFHSLTSNRAATENERSLLGEAMNVM